MLAQLQHHNLRGTVADTRKIQGAVDARATLSQRNGLHSPLPPEERRELREPHGAGTSGRKTRDNLGPLPPAQGDA